MEGVRPKDRLIARVEVITITALEVLLVILVVVATGVLYVLFGSKLVAQTRQIQSVAALVPAMQQSFAGVLTVVLGLELLETLKSYFTENRVRLEVILVVAIIAVGRHVIQVDFEHTPASVLLGLSAVITALTFGYFLVRKGQVLRETGKPDEAAGGADHK